MIALNKRTTYLYRKNLFGDIVAIYQGTTKVAEYVYDAWGNCTVIDPATGNVSTSDVFIGNQNPFRYRGYYWDNDLQLYYLMSRHYDPATGRFINADTIDYFDPETIGGLNLYAYCGNNPVMFTDHMGTTQWWEWALAGVAVAGLIVGSIFTGGLVGGAFLGAAIGAGISLGTQAIAGELNWAQFALDACVGAISGMVGASGISQMVSTFIGMGVGALSDFANQLISGKSLNNIDWVQVIESAIISGLASLAGGPGSQNAKAVNSAPKVVRAMDSVNKVMSRTSSGYYSGARYAKAAYTNVCNRLGNAVAKQQASMMFGSMLSYGLGTIGNELVKGLRKLCS